MKGTLPSFEDYAESIGLPEDRFRRITFEQAKVIAEQNQSMREHLTNWQKAASHDNEVHIPLDLYEMDLSAEIFGNLMLSQVGGKPVQDKLMPAGENNMLIRVLCSNMVKAGVGVASFKYDDSYRSPWTERVAEYHDRLFDCPEQPHLFVVPPLSHERASNPGVSFFISDGNHRALAAGVYHFISGHPLPNLRAIVAWCDRATLETKFDIKV